MPINFNVRLPKPLITQIKGRNITKTPHRQRNNSLVHRLADGDDLGARSPKTMCKTVMSAKPRARHLVAVSSGTFHQVHENRRSVLDTHWLPDPTQTKAREVMPSRVRKGGNRGCDIFAPNQPFGGLI
ncbi:MAG: hypothetical protein IPH31_24705 [Lewinellaceae bacterium]|nr:hypothetical protein [Lewinellaceae bacterium]